MPKLSNDEKNYLLDLREDIIKTKIMTIEEVYLILKYWLRSYLKSILTFGFDHAITKDLKEILIEYMQIRSRERMIHNYILKRGKNINFDSSNIDELLDELEDINDDTYCYYVTIISDIEEACDLKEPYRAKRIKKDFATLIEDDVYIKKLIEGCITIEDISKFLKLPTGFINFINESDFKIYLLDSQNEEESAFYGINYKTDEFNNILDIKLFVPIIIDLNTALINVHEIKRAYELYQRLGNKIDDDNIDKINDEAIKMQKSFKNYIQEKEKELSHY